MAHKQYSSKAIEEAKSRIEYCQKIIDNAKAVKMGDREAVKNAIETVREMEFTARTNVFTWLKLGTVQADNMARYNQGLMEAYQDVITLFEAPDDFVKRYQQDLEADKQFVKEAEFYKKVEDGEPS